MIYSNVFGDSGRMWHFPYLSVDSRVGPARPEHGHYPAAVPGPGPGRQGKGLPPSLGQPCSASSAARRDGGGG